MQSQQFELHFIEYINSAIRTLKVQPLLLNGRPGGYIGQLAQSKVSYDAVESESNAVPATSSLIHNLNRIRHRLAAVEAGVPSGTFLGLLDTPNTYSGDAGKAVVVNAYEDGLEFTTISGIGGGGGVWGTISGILADQLDLKVEIDLLHSHQHIIPVDMISNGGFDSGLDWICGSGWEISGGTANATATTEGLSKETADLEYGETYLVTFDVVVTAEDVAVSVGGTNGITRDTSGTYTETLVAYGGDIYFWNPSYGGFTGSIDNVSCLHVGTGDDTAQVSYNDLSDLPMTEAQGIELVGGGDTSLHSHAGTGSPKIDQVGDTGSTYGLLLGARDGNNTEFIVSEEFYVSGSLLVYLNGQLLTQGSSADWHEDTPASGIFHFEVAPESTDILTTIYY